MPTATLPPHRRSTAFLLIFALANAGGIIGFLPLLTLLLPLKIEGVAGDARIGLVTATVISGAVVASLSNIAFGALSDRSVARGGGRRRWVAGGLVATMLAYGGIAAADTPREIVAAIVVFQCALNAMLGPFLAIMADEIPDAQKGTAGGLLALGSPMASAVSAIVIGVALFDEAARFAIVAAAMALATLPLLLTRARPLAAAPPAPARADMLRRDLVAAWVARLLVQIAGSVLFYYLLYYFESMAPGEPPLTLAPRVGHILTIAYIVPLPIAVLLGRLSDRSGRRKPFLVGAAALATLGLSGMALAGDFAAATVAFGVYATGSAVFLALHAAFAMQLLPSPGHRGRDLGLLNLTNTLPALIGPGLAWLLATPHDFAALMLALAGLTACGGLATLAVRGRR